MTKKLNNKTALIVDDEESNIFALRSYLESLDMKVNITRNGEEAIQFLNGTRPDIILLDIMMPVMDGYETLHALKQNEKYKNIPVIAVTARAMKGDKEKCLQAGAWDYISKPIDTGILTEKLIRWII